MSLSIVISAFILMQGQAQPTISQPAPTQRPYSVSFPVQFSGNPLDPSQNDVRVEFTDGGSVKIERFAYFGSDYAWSASFLPPGPGSYRARLLRNGKPTFEPEKLVVVEKSPELKPIRTVPASRRFQDAGGRPWIALGIDLSVLSMAEVPPRIAAGAPPGGFVRLAIGGWSAQWTPGWVDVERLDAVDAALDAAAKVGSRVQLAILGEDFMSPGASWPSHPWNRANGGFLDSAAEIVAHADAGQIFTQFARYAGARWGAHEALLAWELPALVAPPAWWHGVEGALEAASLTHVLRAEPVTGAAGVSGFQFRTVLGSEAPPRATVTVLNDASFVGLARAVVDGEAGVLIGAASASQASLMANLSSAVSASGLAAKRSASRKEVRFTAGFRGAAISESDWALVLFEREANGPEACDIAALGLADGRYEFEERDLRAGTSRKGSLQVSGFRLAAPFRPSGDVVALTLRRAL